MNSDHDDLIRSWKDVDEPGDVLHPSGRIDLDGLSGMSGGVYTTTLVDALVSWFFVCDGRDPRPS